MAKGEDLNSRDEEGTTALMWAVLNKYNSIVRLLLEHPGIDVSCKGSKGHTALHISLCQKQKKFELCFVELVALEGWYGDPRKRFSNL